MQTFLPLPDFAASARTLDRQRLGKSRIEVMQLLRALTVPGAGWSSHPAALMWRGYVPSLAAYGVAVCEEWTRRGYKDTCRNKIAAFGPDAASLPPWFGDPAFHRSHQSNLIRKLPAHYAPQFPGVGADLPYVWPAVAS